MSTRRKHPKRKPSTAIRVVYDEAVATYSEDPPRRSPRPAVFGLSGPLAWLYDDLVAAAARHQRAGAIDADGREG